MPFIPAALAQGGLTPPQVGLVLALGTGVRLLSGLASARLAGVVGARWVILGGSILAGMTLPLLGLIQGLALLALVQVVHSVAVAPIVPLSDAAAVDEMRRNPFDYGRVRAWGSVAFILAALVAGPLVGLAGPVAALGLAGAALLATGLVASKLMVERDGVPQVVARPALAPLSLPIFRRLLLCSALIQGSHVVYYGFSTLQWSAAGLSAGVIGALWAWGVLAEVLLFRFGRRLSLRLGASGLALMAGGCGVLRWSVTALTVDPLMLFAAQTLHAATFGAMHLAAIRIMADLPSSLGAQAQSLHSALGVGLASGLLMLLSGPLYAHLGGHAFLIMAALCAGGVVAAAGLRVTPSDHHPH